MYRNQQMLYLALLPFLALPGALAGPYHRDTLLPRHEKTPTNEQLFCDNYSGNAIKEERRYAWTYACMAFLALVISS